MRFEEAGWSATLEGIGMFVARLTGDSGTRPPPPVIDGFTVSAPTAALGATVILEWQTTGADTVELTSDPQGVVTGGPTQPTAGSLETNPLGIDTRFVLRAKGPGGTAMAEVTVHVADAARVIFDGLGDPVALAADASGFYWIELDTRALWAASLDGSGRRQLDAAVTEDLVADGGELLYITGDQLTRTNPTTGAVVRTATVVLPAEKLTAAAGQVLWIEPAGQSTLWAVPRDGSAPPRAVLTGLTNPVFTATADALYFPRDGAIQRSALDGSDVRALAPRVVEMGDPVALTVAGDTLWLAGVNGRTEGTSVLMTIPVTGGTPVVRAQATFRVGGKQKIVVDGADVWWWTGDTVVHVTADGRSQVVARAETARGMLDFALAPGLAVWLRAGVRDRGNGAVVGVGR